MTNTNADLKISLRIAVHLITTPWNFYLKDMLRNCKVKQIFYDMINFYFKLSGTFPIVKNTAYNIMFTFLIKYLLDNYNHLRYNKKSREWN